MGQFGTDSRERSRYFVTSPVIGKKSAVIGKSTYKKRTQ